MILIILSVILFIIFMILGGFHFYWLFGGVWGAEKVIPTQGRGANRLVIPKFATLIVAFVLFLFGMMYLIKSGLIYLAFSNWILNYGYWFIPVIFILRAIGEFKYVGFFKRIKHTEFAKADSKLFSPLCLTIGVIGLFIELIK